MKDYFVCDGSRGNWKKCNASNFKELEKEGRRVLGISHDESVRVNLEKSGRDIADEEFFQHQAEFTPFMFLAYGQMWCPERDLCGTVDKMNASVSLPLNQIDKKRISISETSDGHSDSESVDNEKVIFGSPKARAEEVFRYCQGNPVERLALTLVLLGPEFLEAVMDFRRVDSVPGCPRTEVFAMQYIAAEVLAEFMRVGDPIKVLNSYAAPERNNKSKIKNRRYISLDRPIDKLSRDKQIEAIFVLCARGNMPERLTLALALLSSDAVERIVVSFPDEVPKCSFKFFHIVQNCVDDLTEGYIASIARLVGMLNESSYLH